MQIAKLSVVTKFVDNISNLKTNTRLRANIAGILIFILATMSVAYATGGDTSTQCDSSENLGQFVVPINSSDIPASSNNKYNIWIEAKSAAQFDVSLLVGQTCNTKNFPKTDSSYLWVNLTDNNIVLDSSTNNELKISSKTDGLNIRNIIVTSDVACSPGTLGTGCDDASTSSTTSTTTVPSSVTTSPGASTSSTVPSSVTTSPGASTSSTVPSSVTTSPGASTSSTVPSSVTTRPGASTSTTSPGASTSSTVPSSVTTSPGASTSSTVPSSVTTSPGASTSSTVPSSVTTSPGASTSTSTTTSVSVAGIRASNTLPFTGSQSLLILSVATILLASGAVFIVITRRRRLNKS